MRVARIELASPAWKAGILATIRHPRRYYFTRLVVYNKHMVRFSKFIVGGDDPVLHSSKLVQNTHIGSDSVDSFSKRQAIEKQRKAIRSYKDSKVMIDAKRNATDSLRQSQRQTLCKLADRKITDKSAPGLRSSQAMLQPAKPVNPGSRPQPPQSPQPPTQHSFKEPPSRYR